MKFTKMHGIGNDYVYVNCFEETVKNPGAVARYVSDRHFGIGSDGLILICPSENADCRMDMYNGDGSRGIMCGNGVRCVGKYVFDHGMVPSDRRSLTVETPGGIKTLDFEVREQNGSLKAVTLTVDMGRPLLTSELPEAITVDGRGYEFVGINVGNPHAVYFVEDPYILDLEKIGPSFEQHPRFAPDRVNTEFVQVLDSGRIRMRVWERGSGETWACGTGATASAAACLMTGRTGSRVEVLLRGGSLMIRLDQESGHAFMTGPATEVFSGVIDIPEDL